MIEETVSAVAVPAGRDAGVADSGSEAASLLRVVIVNFRTPQLTLDCLDSLESESGPTPGRTWWWSKAAAVTTRPV